MISTELRVRVITRDTAFTMVRQIYRRERDRRPAPRGPARDQPHGRPAPERGPVDPSRRGQEDCQRPGLQEDAARPGLCSPPVEDLVNRRPTYWIDRLA